MPLFGRAARVRGDASALSGVVQLAEAGAVSDPVAAAADGTISARLLDAITRARSTRVTRQVALGVPAFARGLQLITGSVASLPLREYADGVAQPARPLLARPDPSRASFTVVRDLADDLVCYGRGYWQVTDVAGDGPYTYPVSVRALPAGEVGEDADPRWIVHDGRRLRVSDPTTPGTVRGDVLVFGGWDGVLTFAADTIALAAALETTVRTYAATPAPQTALKNTGADLPPDKVDELLDAWEDARASRVTAYLSAAVDVEKLSWNAADLQLVDARNQAALEVGRALNLDPVWIGATPGGGGQSLVYQNRVDLYRQLVDTTLAAVFHPIEQRLSLWDATPRSREVRFDLSGFLRSNAEQRAELVAKLLPLGVMTVDEARALMEYAPTPESAR